MAGAEICTRAAAYALLYRMSKAGEISRSGRGRYELPATHSSEPSESQNTSQSTETHGENGPLDASDASDGTIRDWNQT